MISITARSTLSKSLKAVSRSATRAKPIEQLAVGRNVSAFPNQESPAMKNHPVYTVDFRGLSSTSRGMVSDGVSSANEIKQDSVGTVTRKLRVLDMNVVRTILEGK